MKSNVDVLMAHVLANFNGSQDRNFQGRNVFVPSKGRIEKVNSPGQW